jgi:5'-nucleotidase
VVNVDVPGRVLRAAFEQQWQQGDGGTGDFAPLSVSAGVHVRLDPSRPAGSRLVSLTLDGREIRDARSYRVAMPSRLALGMDGFSALSAGTRPERSDMDYFAFQQWMASQPPISAPARDRVDATAPVQ